MTWRDPELPTRLTARGAVAMALVLGVAALGWVALFGLPVMRVTDPQGAEGGHAHHVAPLGGYLLVWTLMMLAMMLPATAPMVALLDRVTEELPRRQRTAELALFLGTYTALWALTGVVPWVSQQLLAGRPIAPSSVAGVALAMAGIYQLTPAKHACLRSCRAPLARFAAHYRPGALGVVRFAARHTLACIGCCWALMVVMMLLGAMNLALMVGATALTVLEKLLPARLAHRLAWLTGLALSLAGLIVRVRGG